MQTPRIIEAFRSVDRRAFVPEDARDAAYLNEPLAIGYGQTISQPLTVAFMLELLEPEAGQRVLDIGAGSAWQAALIAHIVGAKGRVYALEIIPELKKFGEQNARRAGMENIEFLQRDGTRGLAEKAPFERIIGAASAPEKIPPILLKQLAVGGRIVFPVKDTLVLGEKEKDGSVIEHKFPGFHFVSLIV